MAHYPCRSLMDGWSRFQSVLFNRAHHLLPWFRFASSRSTFSSDVPTHRHRFRHWTSDQARTLRCLPRLVPGKPLLLSRLPSYQASPPLHLHYPLRLHPHLRQILIPALLHSAIHHPTTRTPHPAKSIRRDYWTRMPRALHLRPTLSSLRTRTTQNGMRTITTL